MAKGDISTYHADWRDIPSTRLEMFLFVPALG